MPAIVDGYRGSELTAITSLMLTRRSLPISTPAGPLRSTVAAELEPTEGLLRLLAVLGYLAVVLLVVAGLMVGTATITAALVAADSVGDSTLDAFAFRNWGRVDLTVTARNQFFPRDVADRLAGSPAGTRGRGPPRSRWSASIRARSDPSARTS